MTRSAQVVLAFLLAISLSFAPRSSAQSCGDLSSSGAYDHPPNMQKFARWCRCTGGTYDAARQGCNPGPNRRGSSQLEMMNQIIQVFRQTPQGQKGLLDQWIDNLRAEQERRRIERQRKKEEEMRQDAESAELRRQGAEHVRQEAERRRLAEEQQAREAEAARRKAWEQQREKLLGEIRDTAEIGLGVTGLDDLRGGLREPPADSGMNAPSVVDLRGLGLDPDGPISVDPWVVKGKERLFPVQPDPATLLNDSYNKGFEALRKFDPATAIRHFGQASIERPNDPLVRNALLLAQDLFLVHEKEAQDARAKADHLTAQAYTALADGYVGEAHSALVAARELAPKNPETIALGIITERLAKGHYQSASPEQSAAYKITGHAIVYTARHNEPMAIALLESAHGLAPTDTFITELLQEPRRPKTQSPSRPVSVGR